MMGTPVPTTFLHVWLSRRINVNSAADVLALQDADIEEIQITVPHYNTQPFDASENKVQSAVQWIAQQYPNFPSHTFFVYFNSQNQSFVVASGELQMFV